MNPDCHGEWLLWRAAEGLPYPKLDEVAEIYPKLDEVDEIYSKLGEAAEILADEYAEEINPTEPETAST